MSTNRVSPDAGWINPASLPKGPGGRALCRNCSTEVPKGRRSFCGEACVDDWAIRHNPARMREAVFARDKGVCALCGVDTNARAAELRRQHDEICVRHGYSSTEARQFQREHRWCFLTNRTSYWDADHIVPVIEGGGECGLDNIRTLCISCHKRVTADLAWRRARERRIARQQAVRQEKRQRGIPVQEALL